VEAAVTAPLARRRDLAAAAWHDLDAVILIHAGLPVPIPGGADQSYPFRPHTEYTWLAGRWRPGGVLAFDPRDGWHDFVEPVSIDEVVWEGASPDDPDAAGGLPLANLADFLQQRAGRPLAVLGSAMPGIGGDDALRDEARLRLLVVRRPKDDHELALMRRAAAATAVGFAALRDALAPGISERDLQAALEAGFLRGGGDGPAFASIVGAGVRAAVFHGSPSRRPIAAGELVLVDAGAEVAGYAADVTRTYPVDGRFSPEQADLHAVVLAAQREAIAACRPGQEFRALHLRAAVTLARGLVDLGLLRGRPEDLVDRDVHALFFPHGLGHLVGLGVRDASGYLPGRPRSDRPGLAFLRMDLPLDVGYVTTIEPGLYFVPGLLDDPTHRTRFAHDVNWGRVDAWRHLGGVRIEDDVLVTAGAPEVLTAAIPQ
jgi:Xaa-Pro aminopeptidase